MRDAVADAQSVDTRLTHCSGHSTSTLSCRNARRSDGGFEDALGRLGSRARLRSRELAPPGPAFGLPQRPEPPPILWTIEASRLRLRRSSNWCTWLAFPTIGRGGTAAI